MHESIIAMLCGPHEDGRPSQRRIYRAIDYALIKDLPLLIVGDGNHGKDVDSFAQHARGRRVNPVFTCYDAGANTLTDVRLIVETLNGDHFANVETVHLVTDVWHMARASLFLATTLARALPHRDIAIYPVTVHTPDPPREILFAEARGIRHFLEGNYGVNGNALQFGKPAHPDNVPFDYLRGGEGAFQTFGGDD